jgi:hypothetical protein
VLAIVAKALPAIHFFQEHCMFYRGFASFWVLAVLGLMPPQNVNGHFIDRYVNLSGPGGATGTGLVQLDMDLIVMHVQLNFAGLAGTTTSAQLFAIPKANQAAMAAVPLLSFPQNVTNGTYNQTIDLSIAGSYSPAFIVAADTGLGQSIADALEAVHDAAELETAFIRINTTAFPNGELSGFLTAVPEPSSTMFIAMVLGGGLIVFGIQRIRVRNQTVSS